MQKKTTLTLALLFISSNIISSNTFLNHFHNKPWKFLEYTFITSPESKIQSFESNLSKLSGTALTGAGSLYLAKKFHKKYLNKSIKNFLKSDDEFYTDDHAFSKKLINSTFYIASTGTSAYIFLKLINNFQRNTIEFNALKKFIISWPDNKKFTPEKLHLAFDGAYKLFKEDFNLFREESKEIINLVKKNIYEEFPNKYQQNTSTSSENFFDSKLFRFNVNLQIAQTLEKLIKLFT